MEPAPDGLDHLTEADVPKVGKVSQIVQSEVVNSIVENRIRFVDHGKSVCDVTGVGEPRVPVLGHPQLNSVDEPRVEFNLAAEKIFFCFVPSFFIRVTFGCDCFKVEMKKNDSLNTI